MTDEKEQFAHALLLAELLRRHRAGEVKDTLPEDDTNTNRKETNDQKKR